VRRVALVVLAALALAPAARAWTPAVTATTSFAPQVHAFADPVTATVTVSVDSRRVDPATVRVTPAFAPYSASPGRVSRASGPDGLVVLTFPFRLTCATSACVPHASERAIPLTPARLAWRARNGATRTESVPWPPLLVASRLTPADVAKPSFPFALEPPPAHFAVPPGALGTGLLVVGALLAAGGLGAVGLLLGRRRRLVPVEPLQRALALVEQAASGDVVDRRRALYQLALVLEEARLEPESWAARKLAWAPDMPDPDGMQLLSLVIREQLREATA